MGLKQYNKIFYIHLSQKLYLVYSNKANWVTDWAELNFTERLSAVKIKYKQRNETEPKQKQHGCDSFYYVGYFSCLHGDVKVMLRRVGYGLHTGDLERGFSLHLTSWEYDFLLHLFTCRKCWGWLSLWFLSFSAISKQLPSIVSWAIIKFCYMFRVSMSLTSLVWEDASSYRIWKENVI